MRALTMNRVVGWLTAGAMLAGASGAQAQSRADAIAEQQREKAEKLVPETPGRAEAFLIELRRSMLESPDGIYPTFDTVYPGGGLTGGVGYRRYYGDDTFWNVQGSYSVRNYKMLQAGTTSRGWLRGRLDLQAQGGWRDATQVAYFGLGNDTPADAIARFQLTQAYAGGSAAFTPVRLLRFRGGLDYERYGNDNGGGAPPAIGDVYTPASAPGLGADATYLHAQGTAAIDSRPSPGYARSGGFYGATVHGFAGVADTAGFTQAHIDAVQHIPLLRETWVISLRGRLQTTIGEALVPYYLMPSLGGGSSLRGYSTARFRDRHSLLTTAEWRWIPNAAGLDMALFYDAGIVAPELEGLGFRGMHHDWGIGARFHGPVSTPLRIELARGSEGWHLVFAGSAAF